MEKTSYFICGKGLKMWFNGSFYEKPDAAATEEGIRLSKIFPNVKVMKVVLTGKKISSEIIFKAKTLEEIKKKKIAANCRRISFCH